MNILFITSNGIDDQAYGGPKGSIRNYRALCEFGKVDIYKLSKKSTISSILSLLCGLYPPISKRDYVELQRYGNDQYDLVFFDGSIYGDWVNIFVNTKTVVFYHNCESDFNRVRFGNKHSLKERLYQRLVDNNEMIITSKSDYRVTFSERDSERLKLLYGREANLIIPLGIEDKYEAKYQNCVEEKICLLLGVVCAANVEGYSWFVHNVSPYLDCKTVIAGRGVERYKQEWERTNVSVIGYVEDLEKTYSDANCVVIPLFSGGGMKVKTVEALMFGKTIFGTEEAFSGFEDLPIDVAIICNKADEFIDRINTFLKMSDEKFNKKSRELYVNNYSVGASKKEFVRMMNDLNLLS